MPFLAVRHTQPDAQLAAEKLVGGSVFVFAVEDPGEFRRYLEAERLNLARVAAGRRFEKFDVVTHDVVSFSSLEAAQCSLAYGQILAGAQGSGS